jgi:hypothetical protein
MTRKDESVQRQSGTASGWRSAEGSQFAQKVAFGLGAALLAGAAVATVPAGLGAASHDGYTVTSVTLSAPINAVARPAYTTCCPPNDESTNYSDA